MLFRRGQAIIQKRFEAGFNRDDLPGFMRKTVNLGLDLQGGAHMLLEVDLTSVMENELNNQRGSALAALKEAGRIRTEFCPVPKMTPLSGAFEVLTMLRRA